MRGARGRGRRVALRSRRHVLVALAVVALARCAEPPDEAESEGPAPPAPVTCVPARAGQATDRVVVRGVVSAPPDRDAVVAPSTAGRVAELFVHEGDPVRRGDPIATIEDPSLADAVSEAQASVDAAAATAQAATARTTRAERLLAEGIVARRDAEEARAGAAAADAALRAARSQQRLALARQARARVTSPLAGTVVRVFRRLGDLVDGTSATPVVEVADPSVLELLADVPAADLVRLGVGAVASVQLDAVPDAPMSAHVTAVGPSVDPATSLGSVRIGLDAPGPARLGMAGAARVDVASRAAVLLPAGALRRSAEGGDEVVVCEGTGAGMRARVREVRVGARAGQDVEILRGVAAGESVVVEHVLGIADGAPLAAEPVARGAP